MPHKGEHTKGAKMLTNDPYCFTERSHKNFVPVFHQISKTYGVTAGIVFGMLWLHCNSNNQGVCYAPITEMAYEMGMCKVTFYRHIKTFIEDGYFVDLTPDIKGMPHTYKDTGKFTLKE